MEKQLQNDINELKKSQTTSTKVQAETARDVALINQFNQEVVKPFILEMKDAIKTYPTRSEFDDLKLEVENKASETSVASLKVEVDGKVSRREVVAIASVAGFAATILGIAVSLITIFSKLGG